jgi:hypothetical protein
MVKTKVEILDEIVEYYTNNPRSLGERGCLYNGPNGEHCAFALMCIDPTKLAEKAAASSNLRARGDVILKEEYRGYEADFYDEIQSIHDAGTNWLVNEPGKPGGGLSETGQRKVKLYRECYEKGRSTDWLG